MYEPVVEPPQVQNRPQSGGYGPGSSARRGGFRSGDFEAGQLGRWGGHGECLRRSRGDAAGEELGASLVERLAVNVGTVPGLSSLPAGQVGGGQARCQLLGWGPGGAFVVVRAPESGAHGEGRQRTR